MNAPRAQARHPTASRARGPRTEVESTVSRLASPKLLEWVAQLDEIVPRVLGQTDDEAVHDLRVTLRRIRSLLRIVRPVYGRFHVDSIRNELARIADATGTLRDEEVLQQTLRALELDDAVGADLAAWLARRAHRLRALRSSVKRLLAAGVLQRPTQHLQALLQLPCHPKRDKEVRRFAREMVLASQHEVEEHRQAEVRDEAGMHALRIAHKRLRYAIEAFYPVLAPELQAWKEVAARFQSVLGDLHDCDVAMATLKAASALSPATRDEVLAALSRCRDQIADRYLELVGTAQGSP